MSVAATDLRGSPARLEDDQDVAPRRGRDNLMAVGLLAGILAVLFALAATVGAAGPAGLIGAAEPRSSAQVVAPLDGAPMLDWYRIPDSNR